MAMEATHVLFARDLAPDLEIGDKPAFFAGSIYPDSRYLTRVPRKNTHGTGTPQDPFASGLSDFQKGWATHLLYDRLGGNRLRKLMAKDHDTSRKAVIAVTAMKILEDQQSYDRLGSEAARLFQTMAVGERPIGEDETLIRTYYEINADLYRERPALNDYKDFLHQLIPSPEYVEEIIREAQEFLQNDQLREAILSVYDETLEKSRYLRHESEGELKTF